MLNRKPVIHVLCVSPYERDHEFLASILSQSNWKLLGARDCREAWMMLHQHPISVVIAERRFPGGISWSDLLDEICCMRDAPPVLVAMRGADDTAWSEVLRAGATDILQKPFQPGEVRRAVSSAWQHSRDARRLTPRAALETPRGAFAGA